MNCTLNMIGRDRQTSAENEYNFIFKIFRVD